jgi:hypothetical protein
VIPIKEIENKAQAYVRWNKAFINHFFNEENIGKEVILYADPDLISSIGENNDLGTYNDFLKVIIVDFNYRLGIYDKISYVSKRDVETNRNIKKIITEFPNTLNEANTRLDLIFFNYIIFYISIYVDNNKSSFYIQLNETIKKHLPKERRVQSLSELDNLFEVIENWSLNKGFGLFRARRIGHLSYVGLLNYQVVLKPELNKLFEKLLYKYTITIDDNAIYPELANKLLPYVDNYSLRHKLIEAIKSPVYSEWFLNRALNFNHEAYSQSESGKEIVVTRKGKLTFKIRIEDLSLNLVSDTLLRDNEIPNGFSLSQSGLDNYGYYSEPVTLLNNQKVSFKEYKLNTKENTLELETIKINEVNFFIKTPNGYLLTLIPQQNNDLLVLVRNKNQVLRHWENWSENSNNIEQCTLIEKNENLTNLFGNNYAFYSASNIKKAYYKNEDNVIYEVSSDVSLSIKKLGGLKLNKNTYLDIGLPYFKLDNPEIDSSEINVKVYRNNAKDNDISEHWDKNICRLHINNEVVIDEPSLVIVKFSYRDKEKSQDLVKSFDFIIVGTKLKPLSQSNLFKYNPWGEMASADDSIYFQGNRVVNGNNVLLNASRHSLAGLVETSSYDDNYFIYLLTGLDALIEESHLKRKDINKAIDAALIYLESQGYKISDEKFSRTNLISNLCALGFLNKIKDGNETKYQLLPPALIKIEKSFEFNSKQVYQLLGTRSKYMVQRLVEFCENENIPIKYKRYNIDENNFLEKALLPEIIYLDLGKKTNTIKDFFKDEFDIEIFIEENYHIGDTLNKFIASTAQFETKFLTQKVNLENQQLQKSESDNFPRIVESSELYQSFGQSYKMRFIEKQENTYFKIINLNWSRLYTAKENKHPIALMRKQYNAGNYDLSPNTYIPSKYRLPSIVYRAFCSINHGIPKTIKIFIKNANGMFNVEDQSYMHFDHYKFSHKENRREDIVRVITGQPDINSEQVVFCNELNKNMKFVTCSLYSDIKSAVIIFDGKGVCVAIMTNYKDLLINTDKIGSNGIKTKTCQFGETEINVLKVNNQELSVNQQISLILENNFKEFHFTTPYRNIKFNIVKEEKVVIKEI